MCGIAGYFGYGADEAMLKAMSDTIAHRGPDGEGFYTKDQIGFAHRRLAIIDVAHGQEPMISQDGQTVLVYNGETYNYLELRAELEALGRTFLTNSDTEVVLQSYEEWGEEAFDKFNGMFGLAIHDVKKGKLVLARDHFGIKPLYFATAGTKEQPTLLFGSEIKPLLATGKLERKINERILYRYLQFRIHDEEAETFFEGIDKLMPGEKLVVDTSTGIHQVSMFTRLPEELKELSKIGTPYSKEVIDEYRQRFTEGVRLRLQSEVPVGTALSGGLDSSAVVVTINKLMQENAAATDSLGGSQQTFSAVFPNSINDEEKYADAVLDLCQGNVTSHKILPKPAEFEADLMDFVRTQEEPIISSGPYAQYQVMREASKHVTVLLDGQGADEMMAGYIPYYLAYLRQLRKHGEYSKLAKEMLSSTDILFRLARFQIFGRLSAKKTLSISSLLQKSFTSKYKDERFSNVPDNLKLRLIDDLFHKSLPSVLRYEDKNTMRFSLEGRVPFLDKEVVKYLFSLSDESIIKGGWNKRVLRDATRGMLPSMISNRRNKIGFTTPEAEWFVHMKEKLYEIFLSSSFEARPYWNQDAVIYAFEEYLSGKSSPNTMVFWRLLNTELWLREFFDEPEVKAGIEGKSDYAPNADKELNITLAEDGKTYRRYPIRTEVFYKETDLDPALLGYVKRFVDGLPQADQEHQQATAGTPWYLFISEKIVAMTQGRSIPVWDIKVSNAARFFSKFVTRNPGGIGLASPWSMQLAIDEVGLPRIAYASARSVLGKLQGKSGVFYEVVGHNINAIDGAAGYQVGTSTHSVKYAPKDPDGVARRLSAKVRAMLPEELAKNFGGTAIMDANDLGVVALGHDTGLSKSVLEGIFKDNPQGQTTETTPMSLVFLQS
ncbi:asparagine synthase (glutamine-hydrolyzing) [Psychromicrobium silvestre]|uniref:asparagine synthase (glutamine-hydrolyzing) n=1 Tax=Psychromicrobium silvestre TaxID=1645614 RepID=A0A7Y9LRL1_9MICC|nr:asparagine synthase (glutamine-hydrolyzing) [Psychromicrobium silvestre]NYE94302.1 asparagine synthase (glutamine-hydrolyzing) [Psychromicrobium silvestre]